MRARNGLSRALLPVVMVAVGVVAGAAHAGAQEPVRPPADGCEGIETSLTERTSSVSETDRAEAARLATQASQAAILGDRRGAVSLLERAARLDPHAEDIAYRLGRMLESTEARDRAVRQYCRYLGLDPAGAEAEEVRARIAALAAPAEEPAAVPASQHRASTAFVRGLVLPGSGHMYSGRRELGLLILVSAGATALGGALYTRTEVECLQDPGEGRCPPEMILNQEQSHPYRQHALLLAGAFTVITAVHAAVTVSRGDSDRSRAMRTELPLTVPLSGGSPAFLAVEPNIDVRGSSGVRLTMKVPVP